LSATRSGIIAGTPTSAINTSGTIVPVNVQPIYNPNTSPVVYYGITNSFVILRAGLYQITYYIQGTFQLPCPLGISFAMLIDGFAIPQSVQSIRTGINTVGQGFNISKTFCLLVPDNSNLLDPCRGNTITNSLQISAVGDDMQCSRFITTATPTGNVVTGVGPTYNLGPAGTLQPNNALEVKFMRIGDACPTDNNGNNNQSNNNNGRMDNNKVHNMQSAGQLQE
jgi:hypothetical protein